MLAGVALGATGVVLGASATAAPTTPNIYVTSQGDFSAPGATFLSDDCPAPSACVAAGENFNDNKTDDSLPAVAVESGSTWTVTYLAGTSPADLAAVSCPVAGSCVAVGQSDSSPIAYVMASGQWTADNPSLPFGFTTGELSGISCPAINSCVAVGAVGTVGGPSLAYMETLSNGKWTMSPLSANQASLLGVSCVASVSACVAVGSVVSGGSNEYLVSTKSNQTWSSQTLSSPGQASSGTTLSGVSCTAVGSCLAVGGYGGTSSTSSSELGGVEALSGTTWSAQTLSNSAGSVQYASGVSCPADGSCFAAATNASGDPILERYLGGQWSATPSPVATGTTTDILGGISCASATGCLAVGGSQEAPYAGGTSGAVAIPYLSSVVVPDQGYWLVGYDGGIFTFGSAAFYGSAGNIRLNYPVIGMASTPDGGGYWLVAGDGGVFCFGDAGFYGSMSGKQINAPIAGIAPTADGKGYWLVSEYGAVYPFGDAKFYGDVTTRLNKIIIGIAADPATGGYWLVAEDGGIFSYNAPFYGSAGDIKLNKPIQGMAATSSGGGYWLVATDGGIFAYGDAPFYGSTGNLKLNAPIVSMSPTADGGGYFLTGFDGGIFNYGDSQFYGSMGGQHINAFIVHGVAEG